MKCPCYSCLRRAVNCHSSCNAYAAWNSWNQAIKQAKAAEGLKDSYVSGLAVRKKNAKAIRKKKGLTP